MSSGDGSGDGRDGGKLFFCHVCNRTVTCSDDSEPSCPICHDGFIEEYDPNPNLIPNPNISIRISPMDPVSLLPFVLFPASTTRIDLLNPSFFSNSPHSGTRPEPHMFDPFLFLQNHLLGLQADGTNFQFQINHPSNPEFRLPANIGDYYIGAGFEQLIQQLAENDPNRLGTPPASKDAVEKLPTVTVDDEILKSELNLCPVCQDDFEKGSQVKKMPCKHLYHDECLLPWLEMHSTCPVCRYQLPTDDDDDDGNGGGNSSVQRTFRISLQYPFGEGDSAQNTGERESGNRREGLD